MTFPKTFGPSDIPPSVRSLLSFLLPRLIEGAHPALEVLREQYRVAAITNVELSGVGFFVHFEVPPDAPLANPLNCDGGHAEITLTGATHGAGCALFIRDGRLSMFEGFTYDDPWSEDARVVSIRSVVPISPK